MASFKTTYDVFLSFRGADTRSNFTSHLHQKLVDKNINIFIDDGLNRGEEIESSLIQVIEESNIPLALKVLGSNLCQRSPQDWEIFLNKLEKSPDSKIQSILKVSYDEQEKEEKDIFLDIAVFFRRWSRNRVEDILECCSVENFSWGIIRLRDKCLLTILEDDVLDMHDLIQEMGREIAQREGSRLSNSKDICQVLTNNMEKKKACRVQGCLHISGVKKICLRPKAFSRMKNLRLLKFYRSQENKEPVFVLESGLRCLPNMLSLLHWEEYPCETLPLKFSMENLVELNLKNSNIIQLWNAEKYPQNLKRMDLHGCRKLKQLSNLSSATNLEKINASGCESLVEIDSSISSLPKLFLLDLSTCKKLKMVPEIPRGIRVLYLDNSGVEEWSLSIQFLNHLRFLDMRNCENITCFPIHLTLNFFDAADYFYPPSLDLGGCKNLHKLPEITGKLKKMDLSRTAIKELPQSIGLIYSLIKLYLRGCSELDILPHNICELKGLRNLYLSGCYKLRRLPPLYGLTTLVNLCLDETGLEEIPDDIDSLSSLTSLSLSNCENLEMIPNNICELKSLRVLNMSGCSKLRKLPPFYGLSSLEWLYLGGNTLEEIPNDVGICELKCLKMLDLRGCWKLEKLPPLFGLTSLRSLYLIKCKRLLSFASASTTTWTTTGPKL